MRANKLSSGNGVVITERNELSYRAVRGIITSFGSVQAGAVTFRNVTSGGPFNSEMKLVVPQYGENFDRLSACISLIQLKYLLQMRAVCQQEAE
jgi:hypothetical protein